jgi:4'-phosphopantetheinyl transferase
MTEGWQEPSFYLDDGRIEVWCIRTDPDRSIIGKLEAVLSADEKDRAARFRISRRREEFIIVRGSLRMLLARYLGRPPSEIEFVYGARGKPSLPGAEIDFNVSHADGLAIFAFAQGCALGVDVERVQPIGDMMDIARRFFCSGEADELALTAEADRARAFFLCWTRKEAYIKATGNGLCTPLSGFRVTLRANTPARFVDLGYDGGALDWVLHNIDLTADYVAAIAYRAERRQVIQSQLLEASMVLR